MKSNLKIKITVIITILIFQKNRIAYIKPQRVGTNNNQHVRRTVGYGDLGLVIWGRPV